MVTLSSSLLFIPAGTEIPQADKITTKISPRYLRRTDRFCMLALWGAIECLKNHEVPNNMPLFLVSNSGGRATMKSLKECVITENHLPQPYTFINTLTNTASFLIAKAFSIVSENYVLSAGPNTFNTAIKFIAQSQLLHTKQKVLLGFVEEGDSHNEGILQHDWSAWFLLAPNDSDTITAGSFSENELTQKFPSLYNRIPAEISCALSYAPRDAYIRESVQ